MKIELFIIVLMVLLYLYTNGYIQTNYFSLFLGNILILIKNNIKISVFGFIFIIFIINPKWIENVLKCFINVNGKKQATNTDLLKEYNFVNSIRSLTEIAKKKTDNLLENKKKFLATEQKWKCRFCETMLGEGHEIDYIVPLFRGGTNDIKNLQVLCKDCHNKKFIMEQIL